jgi:nucleoside-diphosphate-sugar epimerase
MQKVVVTGAKGGTGPSIVRVLRQAGYHVLGVDLKPCGFWEQDYRGRKGDRRAYSGNHPFA